MISDSETLDKIEEGINKSGDLHIMKECLLGIAEVNEDIAMDLIPIIARKIEKSDDLQKITTVISHYHYSNKNIAKNLVEEIDKGIFAGKIDETKHLHLKGLSLGIIENVDKNVAEEIIRKVNIKKLVEEIEKMDIEEFSKQDGLLNYCFHVISSIDKDIVDEVLNLLSSEKREKILQFYDVNWMNKPRVYSNYRDEPDIGPF